MNGIGPIHDSKLSYLKVPTVKHGPPAVTMDMSATLWKLPTSSPLTAEGCQHTTSIRSISLPRVLRSPPTPHAHPFPSLPPRVYTKYKIVNCYTMVFDAHTDHMTCSVVLCFPQCSSQVIEHTHLQNLLSENSGLLEIENSIDDCHLALCSRVLCYCACAE